ncbi:hypothetical protein Q4574_19325 [Aliiglaciecola sp. 3_MG-2023]|uniref:hypothetical protein n=1 Tax=Aliiglaciecola sp. 3_MG-2023 TaxID=3062644 RepID=UPI0026E1C584|nr:hypothetical protein [Aliiglaciecola sp. 3_MG-2023]MDO6695459.1 hypothetical protein [Aliiglaciecola sp. 3_MG-2023]
MSSKSFRLSLNSAYWAICIAVCFIVTNFVSGVLVSPNSLTHEVQIRDVGASLALPIIGAFSYIILPFVIGLGHKEILENGKNCGLSFSQSSSLANKVKNIPCSVLVVSVLTGFIIMFSYLYSEQLFYVDSLSFEDNLRRFPLVLQAWWMWTGVILAIAVILRNTKTIDKFIVEYLTVELFRSQHKYPFANTVFWNALFFSIGISLVPLLWIGGEPQFKDFLLAMTVLLILINLTFYPLIRIKQIKTNTFETLKAANQYEWHVSQMTPQVSFEKLTPHERDLILSDAQSLNQTPPKRWANFFHLSIRVSILIAIPFFTWQVFKLVNMSLFLVQL